MIDEDMNVWLIECNTNPSLAESSAYLSRLLNRAVEDMLKLTIDSEYMFFYQQVIEVNKQLKAQTEEAGEVLPANMVLADEDSLERILNIPRPELEGINNNESIWERLLNIKERGQRKKSK